MVIRQECYQRIRKVFQDTIRKHYEDHPEYLGDDRSQEAIEKSVKGLELIFRVLDDYEISKGKGVSDG
jgi:hypothetical protein